MSASAKEDREIIGPGQVKNLEPGQFQPTVRCRSAERAKPPPTRESLPLESGRRQCAESEKSASRMSWNAAGLDILKPSFNHLSAPDHYDQDHYDQNCGAQPGWKSTSLCILLCHRAVQETDGRKSSPKHSKSQAGSRLPAGDSANTHSQLKRLSNWSNPGDVDAWHRACSPVCPTLIGYGNGDVRGYGHG